MVIICHIGYLKGIHVIVLIFRALLVIGIVSCRGVRLGNIGAETELSLAVAFEGVGDVEMIEKH